MKPKTTAHVKTKKKKLNRKRTQPHTDGASVSFKLMADGPAMVMMNDGGGHATV